MITLTGLKWVPDFAKGNVRDLRVRWALEEAGLPYVSRLLDAQAQAAPGYRAVQPFGQVPALDEDGLVLFESGAIVWHVAERCEALLPREARARAAVLSWLFASLNTIEPPIMNLAEVDFFMEGEARKADRRPMVLEQVDLRLGALAAALGTRAHLVGDFSVADLMMASVLRILKHTDLLDRYPSLAAYRARCEARPAFRRALAAQLADFERR